MSGGEAGIAHPNGKILHAEISIAGSVVMIGDPGDSRLYSEPREMERRGKEFLSN
jgi:uncharacterized glyoxalase superfamily protein PhnB